jgi:hypothetical protein
MEAVAVELAGKRAYHWILVVAPALGIPIPAIVKLLRLGHCHRRGTISRENTYNRVWSFRNNSILKELNVWRGRVTSY